MLFLAEVLLDEGLHGLGPGFEASFAGVNEIGHEIFINDSFCRQEGC